MERAVLRPGALPLGLEPALAPRLPARASSQRGEFEWLQLLTHPEIWAFDGRDDAARRWSRSSTPTGQRASSTCAPTGSTCREADHRHGHRLGRAGNGRAPARAARERRARAAARRHRHERALGRAAPLRRVPPRPRRRRPGVPGRDARRSPSARASTRSCRSRRSTSKGSRRTSSASPIAGARLAARRDPPLERQGRDVRVPAPARRAGAGVPARQRRARGRGGRARARLPGARRCASSRCSRPARAASASSTRRSTARTSSCNERPGSVSMRLEEAVEILPGRRPDRTCS